MINVTLDTETRRCVTSTQLLGFEGEHLSNKLIFKFNDGFIEGSARLLYEQDSKVDRFRLQQMEDYYELEITKDMLDKPRDVKFQFVVTTNNGAIYKYFPFVMEILDAIDELTGSTEATEEQINSILQDMKSTIEDGELVIDIPDNVDIDFYLYSEGNLVVEEDYGNIEFELNNNKLEVQY